MSVEADVELLKAQVNELRRKLKLVSDWHDTMRSPLHMKLWWWAQGYRMFSLGTWYRAPWNRAAGDKYNGEF